MEGKQWGWILWMTCRREREGSVVGRGFWIWLSACVEIASQVRGTSLAKNLVGCEDRKLNNIIDAHYFKKF